MKRFKQKNYHFYFNKYFESTRDNQRKPLIKKPRASLKVVSNGLRTLKFEIEPKKKKKIASMDMPYVYISSQI